MGGLAHAGILDVTLSSNPIAIDTWTTVTVYTSEEINRVTISTNMPYQATILIPESGVSSFEITSNYPGLQTVSVGAAVVGDGTIDWVERKEIPLVVYDPDTGFISGAGWINSPPGAYVKDPSLTGKAQFAFISKYVKKSNTPAGHTAFMFQAGDLNFQSSSYEWLLVTQPYTRFKGTGTINGEGGYEFMIWAQDSDATYYSDIDTFRIKIWRKEDEEEIVIYDNGIENAVEGGNIIVHEGDDYCTVPPCGGAGGGI